MLRQLAQFRRSESGAVAMEFGLIAPILGVLLIGTIEVCNALEARQKVVSVASTVSDLASQTKTLSSTDVSNIFSAAGQIMYPFSSTNMGIVVSSVVSDGHGNGTVAWSESQNATALAANSAVTVPTGLMTSSACAAGACSVILATVTYNYTSPMGEVIPASFTMTDYFYSKPRESATVSYTG